MYSFLYEESETWTVWSKDVDLSAFNGSTSSIIIEQIFRQLFDGVREQTNDLKNKIQKNKSLLKDTMNELLTFFEAYRTEVQVNEVFVRYFVNTHRMAFYFLSCVHTF